jgi:hypothetical protein
VDPPPKDHGRRFVEQAKIAFIGGHRGHCA